MKSKRAGGKNACAAWSENVPVLISVYEEPVGEWQRRADGEMGSRVGIVPGIRTA